ncbi:MAG: family 20 glycosylhydrolase [Gemmatimonadota bacterium]
MRLRLTIAANLLLRAGTLQAQAAPALMPLPAHLETREGQLRLDSTLSVSTPQFTDERLRGGMLRALAHLGARMGQPLVRQVGTVSSATLTVRVAGAGEVVQTPGEDESYTLDVGTGRATLTAPTVVGALRGLETLQQLLSGDARGFYLPAVHISDQPRFPWRGLLIDAGRHFMPPAVILRTLDGMAAVKLNVLHWHLSEDQGFRVESLRYPRLQQLGSDGQYYTQEQIREIVAYARDRGIRVVPEFDMPGHSTSWFVGYPQYASAPGPYQIIREFGVFDPAFDPTREETYQFIEGFIAEMAPLFPDPYWHIGGDEVAPTQWNRNPRILRFKREKGLKDNDALQAYFNQRLSQILTRHHKRMVGWDEILHPALPKTTVVQSWRGTEYLGRAARDGYSGILSAPYYLDHIDPTDQLYLADPLPAGNSLTTEESARVLGGEACMWAEHVNPETVDSRIWPRMAAIAERFWSPASVRDVDDMYRRLSPVSIQLEGVGLTHEAHTYRMLRLLAGRRGVQPLHDLLAVTMPVTFGQRYEVQHTTQLTPLTRLVDAARPDPWMRSQLMRLATEVLGDSSGAAAARAQLLKLFSDWKPLSASVAALGDSLPLARDGEAAANALTPLADLGLQALDYLGTGHAPPGWKTAAKASLEDLARPKGMLRLAGVEAVRRLVEGVN